MLDKDVGAAAARHVDRVRHLSHWAADSLVYRSCLPQKVVLLAGSPRSGTTWLAEVLNPRGTWREYFEPFDRHRNPEVSSFHRHQYLPPATAAHSAAPAIERILTGRIHYRRVVGPVRLGARRGGHSLLVKDVWANLLLPWIVPRFTDLKVALIVRHPCAVAVSRLRLGWPSHLSDMTAQAPLMERLESYQSLIRTAHTPFRRQVMAWAIDNHVPLNDVAPDRLVVVRYEDLLSEPALELPRLSRALGIVPDDGMMDRVDAPSSTDWNGSERGSRERAFGWQREVSPEDRRWTDRVVEAFGLPRQGDPG